MTDLVAVEPFRRAAQKHGSFNDIARRMGYTTKNRQTCPTCGHGKKEYVCVDSFRVKRDLGIVAYQDRDGRRHKMHMTHAKALRYCMALDLLPTEVGL